MKIKLNVWRGNVLVIDDTIRVEDQHDANLALAELIRNCHGTSGRWEEVDERGALIFWLIVALIVAAVCAWLAFSPSN
jgi:hypothetical protein